MEKHSPETPEQHASCDINRITLTGIIVKSPELRADPYGALIVSVLLSSRSRWQRAAWGTYGQQSYLFTILALGSTAEQLATLQPGTQLVVDGSLDYAYHPSATSVEARWTLAVRAERIGILQLPEQCPVRE